MVRIKSTILYDRVKIPVSVRTSKNAMPCMATPSENAASTWRTAGNGAGVPAKVHKLVFYENGMHDETIYYC